MADEDEGRQGDGEENHFFLVSEEVGIEGQGQGEAEGGEGYEPRDREHGAPKNDAEEQGAWHQYSQPSDSSCNTFSAAKFQKNGIAMAQNKAN